MTPTATPLVLALCLASLASGAAAEVPVTAEDDHGILNPDDTGKDMIVRKLEMGVVDSVTCSLGINVTKKDDPVLSRKLIRKCADAGITKAMTWMSHLENNGLGGPYNPDASAEWDRKAAEAGDPIGKFNHGLNLMRGHGTTQDEALGRAFIDEAARDGLQVAKRLQGVDYDLDEVTPDADNWKYAPLF
ncbi:tetratricopeptide repeat protein [Dinoroseobacter sp. S375]|uniref:tetratricopeptide repeat protein n=1 Tax=Dinoroseobacter sp. S375 TaxID=3415136 RepID=UPI003C7BEEC0